ncbi:group II intron maturase-specific domain-containing protein [Streptomyces kaempferi]|uniref:Group II intron maturase-specific domain-containing protein n=1 Tax=Streptomyces kaempferi TaxID=333725 RepID=A0ABW3XUC8_9ACTN
MPDVPVVPPRRQRGSPAPYQFRGAVLAAAPPHQPDRSRPRTVHHPIVRGWMAYYGAFYQSALHPLLERVNAYVMRWMRKKFKRLRGRKKAQTAWNQAVARRPRFFAHWAWTTHAPRVW